MRIRCQENGEGAALSLDPLLEGPLLGGVIGSSLTYPTLIPAFPVSLWLVLIEGARPVCPPAHHLCQLPAHRRKELLPGQALPTWSACLSGALQHRVAGSSLRAWGLFAFRSGVSSPPPLFPEAPASRLLVRLWVQTQGWLFLPTPSWGPLRTRPPGLEMAAAPQLVLCSQLWWLDLVLNNELLKQHEQCVSHVLTHAEPLLWADSEVDSAVAAPSLASDLRVSSVGFQVNSRLSSLRLKNLQSAASSLVVSLFSSGPRDCP